MSSLPSRPTSPARGMAMALCVLVAALAVYWPVLHAPFVWDDFIFVRDAAWLHEGASWTTGIFEPFSDAKNYFRPLGMALYAGESRLFGASAPWLHLVSLLLHLANAALVGTMAVRLRGAAAPTRARASVAVAVAMAVFALDPLLAESVAWVSNQFELLAVLFILLGLTAHLSMRRGWVHVVAVTACFFFAACAKESAISFPVLLAIVDWMRAPGNGWRESLAFLRRQWPVYLAVLCAGVGYLVLRRISFGHLVAAGLTEPIDLLARFQLVCYTYLTYWKVLLWPMQGIGPFHVIDYARFRVVDISSLLTDAGALALVAFGLRQLWKRAALGALIISASAAMFAVLHIVPINFDDSYYHDRFATLPLALACAWLPAVAAQWRERFAPLAKSAIAFVALALLWLIVAVANVRITLPMWADEALLWQWVLRDNPSLLVAQSNLLALYLDRGDLPHAHRMAEALDRQKAESCFKCMLNVAQLAVIDKDAEAVEQALAKAKKAFASGQENDSPHEIAAYIKLTGDLHRLRGDAAGAEAAYRDAIDTEPSIAATHISLALVLVDRGKIDDARAALDDGVALLPADERARQRESFENYVRERLDRTQAMPGG